MLLSFENGMNPVKETPGNILISPAAATAEHFEMGYGNTHLLMGSRGKKARSDSPAHPGEQPNRGLCRCKTCVGD